MITVEGVTKSFGTTHALDGVSLSVGAGEILGLLGPNGAGKTTLVRMLATLLTPDTGVVRVAGIDVTRDPRAVRERIGLAGQAAAVDEVLTGRENIELIGALYGLGSKERKARGDELLERFDLQEASDRLVRTFSGGMRRRLDLAATLVGQPDVILLDEPTAGLDPRSRNELWSLVGRVAADGTTVLLTTQYLEEAERLAGRIVVLDRGLVVADGTPAELKHAVGRDVLEVRVVDERTLEPARALMSDLGDGAASVDVDDRRVLLPTGRGTTTLVAAARRLDEAGIALADLGVRRPSLDDVFLALTGGDIAQTQPVLPKPRTVDTTTAPRPDAKSRHSASRDMAAVTGRYFRRFVRIPQLLFLGMAQPIGFILGLDAVFSGVVEQTGTGLYMQYLLPGVLVMTVMFGASVTSFGLAEDLQAGIIDRFRSLPMSRSAVVVGRTVFDLARNALSLVIVSALGLAFGYRAHGGVLSALGGLALLLFFSFAVSWLFAVLGMAIKNPQAAQLAGFLPVLPLVYLSGAWIPIDTMSSGVQAFARNQPINVLVESLRALGNGTPAFHWVWQSAAWSCAILLIAVPLSVRQYRGDGA